VLPLDSVAEMSRRSSANGIDYLLRDASIWAFSRSICSTSSFTYARRSSVSRLMISDQDQWRW